MNTQDRSTPNKQLLCLGDSTVFGYGVDRKDRWLTLLQGKSGWHLINRGKNRDTTDGMLSRFSASDMITGTDEAFLLGGNNDIFTDQTVEHALRNLQKLIEAFLSHGIPVLLSTTIPYIYPFDPPYWADAVDFDDAIPKMKYLNARIRSLTAQYAAAEVALVDLYSHFAAFPEEELRALYVDELHFNARGHRIAADHIGTFLK